jgi:hypothetical protein
MLAMAPTAPATTRCATSVGDLMCVEATATLRLTCTTAANFTCAMNATVGAAGWSALPMDGSIGAPWSMIVKVCTSSGCVEDFPDWTGGCTWSQPATGCEAGARDDRVLSGAAGSCAWVYGYVKAEAYGRFQGAPVTLASAAMAREVEWGTAC